MYCIAYTPIYHSITFFFPFYLFIVPVEWGIRIYKLYPCRDVRTIECPPQNTSKSHDNRQTLAEAFMNGPFQKKNC